MKPLNKIRLLATLGILCALAFAGWAVWQQGQRESEGQQAATIQQQAQFEAWHGKMRADWDAIEYGELVEAEATEEDNHMANGLTVAGAGSGDVNAHYDVITGGDKNAYVSGDDAHVEWLGDRWSIYIPGMGEYYSNSADTPEPPETGWTIVGGDAPAPTVTLDPTDVTAPEIAVAAITSVGNILAISWTEADSPPVVGSSGLSLDNLTHGAATLSNVVTTGTGTTADISRIIYDDEAPTLSYTPGDFADSADTPNPVEAFSGVIVANDSPWELWPASSSSMLMVF